MPSPEASAPESVRRTLLTALLVAVVCAAAVSGATVLLRPLQEAHRAEERRRSVDELIARMPGVETLFAGPEPPTVETRVIELATGHAVTAIDPQGFDARAADADPQTSIPLPAHRDLAGLGRRATYAVVHLVRHDERLRLLVLPVRGWGYDSLLRGFLALEGDLETVAALTFFEHEETPGLGGEIDDPAWRAQWRGKRLRDASGRLRLGVAPGKVAPGSPDAAFQVDAITGATMTSRGVDGLVRFWLGEDGFAPFLRSLRAEEGQR